MGQWIQFAFAAIIPAIAAVIAAVVAARSLVRSKRMETEYNKLKDLELRVSEKKAETYQPLIGTLAKLFDGGGSDNPELLDKIREFSTWIVIYGSDESIRSFHNLLQSAYHQAPPFVTLRFYAEFVLAARKDLGYPDTGVKVIEFLGIRINDIYSNNDLRQIVTVPLEQLGRTSGWSPPWIET